jgi:uncharacterized phage protein (TIGR01671 family)
MYHTTLYGISELLYGQTIGQRNIEYAVMQCTGVKDKRGQLIYSGDIVRFGGETYEIKFADACFWIDREGHSMELHTTLGQADIEIIGNIYENSELLNVAG